MNVLKVARTKLGLTQAQMAKKANVHTNTVINWEAAKNAPTLEKFVDICNAYQLTALEVQKHFIKEK